MQVQSLINPSADEFRKLIDSVQPNIVYFQGQQLPNHQVGSLLWEQHHHLPTLFDSSSLPTTVCSFFTTLHITNSIAYFFYLCIYVCMYLGIFGIPRWTTSSRGTAFEGITYHFSLFFFFIIT